MAHDVGTDFRPEESGMFQTALPSAPDTRSDELWSRVVEHVAGPPAPAKQAGSVMEFGLSPIELLDQAPPRTIQSAAIKRASPMSGSVRAMIERREFGRSFTATQVDLDPIRADLPGIACPSGPVEFLANDASFERLGFTVDCLLQHRKHLVESTVNPSRPRSAVLVLGAGPGGLMAAIQLRLRGHEVVICEQREVYTRNRFIGVYKPVAHLLAALGMPERMTYDFTHYRGKRGVMLADIQTFLHGVALKLGAVIYTGAVAHEPTLEGLRNGELELQRSTRGDSGAALGITRWHYDTVMRVRSGVSIRFDTIIEATGGRSGIRELLVGRENVVTMRTVARDAALVDASLDSYFDLPEDHSAQFIEANYGCPPAIRREYAEKLIADDANAVPDALPSLVSNIDASIIVKPIEATARVPGIGARIGDKELDIPRDWVLVRCPLPDQTLTRYQIEGPLPQTFEFDGKRISTAAHLGSFNPVTLLVRVLYAMGVPFESVDRRRLVEFYTQENSQGDASDIVAVFVGTFRGLRLGGARPIWCGRVPGSDRVAYGIIGEALQNAWYRFGVGVDDTFAGATHFAENLELDAEAKEDHARRFERVMIARSVQVQYHLYLVNQNTDQGVVGPVLTESYIDRRHRVDLAEARLREEWSNASGMLATLVDLRSGRASALLEAAVEHRRDICFRTVLGLLSSFDYDPRCLERATRAMMRLDNPERRARAIASLEGVALPPHLELLKLLAEEPAVVSVQRSCEERLVELGIGQYPWVTPWVQACALRALDPRRNSKDLLRAMEERNALVAETAATVLASVGPSATDAGARSRAVLSTIDRVILLKDVRLFGGIPHEELADVAKLLTERWAAPGECIGVKGDIGDRLFILCSGSVRVHDGDRTLTYFGPGQTFGELSVLDAEPLVASATAAEETHLLQLGQDDFYAISMERPQILMAITREFCRKFRGMTNMMRGS